MFTVSAGETVPFILTYGASHLAPSRRIDPIKALADTEAFWRDWADRAKPAGAWSDAVIRSLMTLKALTYQPTGTIAAAPTTALPEKSGGTFKKRMARDIVLAYYAHPTAWSEIGWGGPASPRGYVRMDFNERDPWEAAEVKDGDIESAKRKNRRVG